MRSVQKTRVQLFRLSFSTGGFSRKSRVFRLDPPVGILSRKKLPFFDRVRKPDLGFSRKRPFSTDKSDCIRNGLRVVDPILPVWFCRPKTKLIFCFGYAIIRDGLTAEVSFSFSLTYSACTGTFWLVSHMNEPQAAL